MTYWHPCPIPLILQLTRARTAGATQRALQDLGAFMIVLHDARQYGVSSAPGMDSLADMVGSKRDRAGAMKKQAIAFLREFEEGAAERRQPAPKSHAPAALDVRLAELRTQAERSLEWGRQVDAQRLQAEERAARAESAHLEALGRATRAEAALERVEATLAAVTLQRDNFRAEISRLRCSGDAPATAARPGADAHPTPSRRPADPGPTPPRSDSDPGPTGFRSESDIEASSYSMPPGVSSDTVPTPNRPGSDPDSTHFLLDYDPEPTGAQPGPGGTEAATPARGSTLTPKKTLKPTFTEEEEERRAPAPPAQPPHHPLESNGGSLSSERPEGTAAEASTEERAYRLAAEDVLEAWSYAWFAVMGRESGKPPAQPGGTDRGRAREIARRHPELQRDRLQAAAEMYLHDWKYQHPAKRWPSDYPTVTTFQVGISGWLARLPRVEEEPPAYVEPPAMPPELERKRQAFWDRMLHSREIVEVDPDLEAWWAQNHPELLSQVRKQLERRTPPA